jgi:hypothetical protein
MRRLGLAIAAASLALALGWSSAAFGDYPPNAIGITTSSSASCAGGSLTVSGVNFESNESVTVTLSGSTTLGTATADPNGSFTTTVTIPAGTAPGTSYTIVATGASGDTSSTAITIDASCTPSSGVAFTPSSGTGTDPGSGLAFTGADIAAMSGVGAIALGLGGFLILAGRRRRTTRV